MIRPQLALFLTGLFTFGGQLVLLRELVVAFFGVELVYLIALGLWCLLAALGTVGRGGRREPPPLAGPFLLFSLSIPFGLAFLRGSRIIMGGVPGSYLPVGQQALVVLLSLAPAAILSGCLFRRAAASYTAGKRTLAGAYGLESAGCLAGGGLFWLALLAGWQNFSLAAAASLGSAAASLLFSFKPAGRAVRTAALAMGLACALLLWKAEPLDLAMTALNHEGLVASRDTPYSRITVTNLSGQVSVFENDVLTFSSEGTEAELFAQLAALQHEDPKRILLLGGGGDGTIRELIGHKPGLIDWLEMDAEAVALVRPFLPPDIRSSLDHDTVRLSLADPRSYVKERGPLYDLILVAMPPPGSGRTNRFYTREFFQECRGRLNPAGILALRLATAENLWTPPQVMQVASIRAALKEVFPEVLILTAPTTILTASRVRLPSSEAPLIRRLQERGIKTRLVSPYYLRYLFTNDRNLQARAVLAGAKAPANTDLRPLCYLLETQLWLSRFFPSLGAAEVAPKAASLWPLLLVTGLLFLASRLREGLRRWLLVAAAAFAGTLLEALLLMAHQAACGSLYQDLAVLMMAFMAGLALGASITNAIMAGRARKRRILGFVLTAALVLLGGATWARVRGLLPAGLAVSSSLILASGFLVAAMLAYASLRGVRDQGTVIAPLYAADLLGGCLGMLSGGLFAIPLLGLDGSSLAVTGLAGLCLLLL